MKIFILILGLIAIVKGSLVVIFPENSCSILDFYKVHIRALGITVAAIGVVCVVASVYLV